jgi:predicted MFS family arabinose efflux permease
MDSAFHIGGVYPVSTGGSVVVSDAGRPKGIFPRVPPQVKALIYLTSFSSVAYGFLMMSVAAYLPEVGITSGQVGLLLGLNGAALVVTAVPIGLLADRIGRKSIFIWGLAGLSPIMLVYAFTTDFTYLAIASLFAGLAEGAFLSTWNAMIADQTGQGGREEAFSMSFIFNTTSTSVGFALPLAFPALQALTGLDSRGIHSSAFFILAIVAFISPVALRSLLRNYNDRAEFQRTRIRKIRNLRVILKFSAINSLIGLGAGFVIPLVPTYLFLRFALPDTYTGPLLALSGITIGLVSVVSPWLSRRYGIVRAIVLTQGISTVFMFAIPFMPDAPTAAAVYLVRSALMNMGGPLVDTFMMGIVTKEERGVASAINMVIWRLPNSVTTIVGGILLASGQFVLPFIIAASFYVLAITLFFFNFKDTKLKG